MIQAARKVIFCLDHTKLGRESLSSLCELDVVDIVVTDSKASREHVAMMRGHGVQVIVAESDSEK